MEFWRRGRAIIGYGAFAVILFLAFLVASFPYADTLSALLEPLKLRVAYQSQHASAPIGATLENVRLFSTLTPDAAPLIESPEVRLTPTLASILFGHPGIGVALELFGGHLGMTARRSGTILRIAFDCSGLRLEQEPTLRELGADASGTLSSTGWAIIAGPAVAADNAEAKISGSALALRIVTGLPLIHFGDLAGTIRLNQGTLEIQHLASRGSDVAITATGTIVLGPDLEQSTIDMTIAILPTAAGQARLSVLLGLLPHPPGDGPYFVRGSLMAPSLS